MLRSIPVQQYDTTKQLDHEASRITNYYGARDEFDADVDRFSSDATSRRLDKAQSRAISDNPKVSNTSAAGRVNLALPTDLSNILSGWDPNRQVLLGIATESVRSSGAVDADAGSSTVSKAFQTDGNSDVDNEAHGDGDDKGQGSTCDALDGDRYEPGDDQGRVAVPPDTPPAEAEADPSEAQGSGQVHALADAMVSSVGQDSARSTSAAWRLRMFRRRSSSGFENPLPQAPKSALQGTPSRSSILQIMPNPPPVEPGGDQSGPNGAVSWADLVHIRTTLARADLANLEDEDPNLHSDIIAGRRCLRCPTRFSIFSRGRSCNICSAHLCTKCSDKLIIPKAVTKEASEKPVVLCADCKAYLGGVAATMMLPNT